MQDIMGDMHRYGAVMDRYYRCKKIRISKLIWPGHYKLIIPVQMSMYQKLWTKKFTMHLMKALYVYEYFGGIDFRCFSQANEKYVNISLVIYIYIYIYI